MWLCGPPITDGQMPETKYDPNLTAIAVRKHRAEAKRGSVPARDNDAVLVPVGSGTKAGRGAQGESRSYTMYDMTEVFSNGSNCR